MVNKYQIVMKGLDHSLETHTQHAGIIKYGRVSERGGVYAIEVEGDPEFIATAVKLLYVGGVSAVTVVRLE